MYSTSIQLISNLKLGMEGRSRHSKWLLMALTIHDVLCYTVNHGRIGWNRKNLEHGSVGIGKSWSMDECMEVGWMHGSASVAYGSTVAQPSSLQSI